ncbi:unnamed protein product [Closterium sp. Naga37s-1]|nr:unnamed protein product [Closterium sp. Naga37s-1]
MHLDTPHTMAHKRKDDADTTDNCPHDLNEILYFSWMNKQIAAGRKPADPVPQGTTAPRGFSSQVPRDVPSRVRRDADRVASSRTFDNDGDESDYNEYAVGTDDDAKSGEDDDKGMFDDDGDAEGADDEAPEETQPETPTGRVHSLGSQ